MSEYGLDIEVDEGVMSLTIRNPQRKNALNNDIANSLIAACETVDRRSDVAAVLVRGADGQFCSGADTSHLGRRADIGGTAANFEGGSVMYDAFQRLARVKAPTIAVIRGAAVGAGLNLAMATDVRIASLDARIIAGFGRARLHPGGGFFHLITRTAGRQVAAAMAVFGEEVSGTRAAELGLVYEALPDAEVEARAFELASRCAVDPELSRRTVQSLRQIAGPPAMDWPAAVELERLWQLWSLIRRSESSNE